MPLITVSTIVSIVEGRSAFPTDYNVAVLPSHAAATVMQRFFRLMLPIVSPTYPARLHREKNMTLTLANAVSSSIPYDLQHGGPVDIDASPNRAFAPVAKVRQTGRSSCMVPIDLHTSQVPAV